jgi:acetyl-CoA carboxylase biotin carboxylase subunit
VAAGKSLPFEQSQIARRGHAIECRVYAEDPARGFLPSPGKISALRLPQGPGTRNDEGALAGDEIPDLYDPMVSKLMTWGSDRTQSRARMLRALAEYTIDGLRNNLEFCSRVLQHPAFHAGRYDTSFATTLLSELTCPESIEDAAAAAAAAAHWSYQQLKHEPAAANSSSSGMSPWVAQHRAAWLGKPR